MFELIIVSLILLSSHFYYKTVLLLFASPIIADHKLIYLCFQIKVAKYILLLPFFQKIIWWE